ncbi:hypothetical protein QR680_014956 [Steinernema hermaphroditum]|uniref:Uncharacterized protein n=1 Tax=Steinernema hermaphroditum TaxID=289476 RepID=A0AA39M4R2_9BILA|nr:hypothetical protein QR680_014956 [Steinernema hermaphroditum]
MRIPLLFAVVTLLIPFGDGGSCRAKCSPHVTLPCSFPSLDRCLEKTCKDLCQKDGRRTMNACYCRGSVEGLTIRACFCNSNSTKPKLTMF